MKVDAESYAPVVAWSTIRLFLCLTVELNWITVSADWANAFIQATLKKPMYMATPRGFFNKYGKSQFTVQNLQPKTGTWTYTLLC